MLEDNTKNPSTEPKIVSHEFSGDKCKVLVEGGNMADLSNPAMKRAVYEYRHKIGASHMGLNKFEPSLNKVVTNDEGQTVRQGFWHLMAGL